MVENILYDSDSCCSPPIGSDFFRSKFNLNLKKADINLWYYLHMVHTVLEILEF